MSEQADSLPVEDRCLLDELQRGLPLAAEPFAALAERLGGDPDAIVTRLRRLKADGVIRQLSAIFDTRAMGYDSSLVAGRCRPGRLDTAAAVVNAHPGVSHNYQRNAEFNLWFTLALPPDSRLGLARTVEALASASGAESMRLLPALKLFKIGVRFDLTGEEEIGARGDAAAGSAEDPHRASAAPPGDRDIAMIRLLQEDLPLERRPFDAWARQGGVTVEELLATARRFQAAGQMRRFAAVLHHRAAGFAANAMGVWIVPADRVEAVGRQMAQFKSVSHCYLRPTYPDWPYNLFTMVHGRSADQCEAELRAIQAATGVPDMRALYSVKEYKKTRVRYFTPDIARWEAEHGG